MSSNSTKRNALSTYLVQLNVSHYCGKQRVNTRDGIVRRNKRAAAAFMKDIAANLSYMEVTFESAIDGLAIVAVRCTAGAAAALEGLSGVSSVSLNRQVKALPARRKPAKAEASVLKNYGGTN